MAGTVGDEAIPVNLAEAWDRADSCFYFVGPATNSLTRLKCEKELKGRYVALQKLSALPDSFRVEEVTIEGVCKEQLHYVP